MRPVLLGLAVVASLATSLVGANAIEKCGGVGQMSCLDLAIMERKIAENFHNMERQSMQRENPRRFAVEQAREWAEKHLATEHAEATFWRDDLVDHHRDGSRTGWQITLWTAELAELSDEPYIDFYTCDPNYGDALSGGCVGSSIYNNCTELRARGIVNIPVLGEDWMLLDDDHDGMGCEVEPVDDSAAAQTAQAVVPTPESPDQCDGVLGMLGCLLGR